MKRKGEGRNPSGPVARPPRRTTRRSRGTALLTLTVLAGAGAVLAAVDGKSFFRALSLGGTALLLLSVSAMVAAWRRAKRVAPLPVLTTIAASVASLGLYLFFVGFTLAPRFVPPALLAGFLAGAGWALASRLHVARGAEQSIGGGWHLAVWGLIFAGSQGVSLVAGRPPAVATVLLLAGTGLVAGHGLTLLTRSRALQAAAGGER